MERKGKIVAISGMIIFSTAILGCMVLVNTTRDEDIWTAIIALTGVACCGILLCFMNIYASEKLDDRIKKLEGEIEHGK